MARIFFHPRFNALHGSLRQRQITLIGHILADGLVRQAVVVRIAQADVFAARRAQAAGTLNVQEKQIHGIVGITQNWRVIVEHAGINLVAREIWHKLVADNPPFQRCVFFGVGKVGQIGHISPVIFNNTLIF